MERRTDRDASLSSTVVDRKLALHGRSRSVFGGDAVPIY